MNDILAFGTSNNVLILCVFAVLVMLLLSLGDSISRKTSKLNNVKSQATGDGQYGTASWMTNKEARKIYKIIKLPIEINDYSNNEEAEYMPVGRVVHYDVKKKEVYIDTSKTHCEVEAPTETGKTSKYVIPNIQYSLMSGANLIIPDIKGELLELTANNAIKCGYNVYTIDFRIEMMKYSSGYNLLSDINENWDEYIKTGNIMHLAKVENSIESLATDISSSTRGKNENPYFVNGSLALMKVAILMTTMFGSEMQRHFGSVVPLLQEISSIPKQKGVSTIATLLASLNSTSLLRKFAGSAFSATNETEDNLFSSVLGDLVPFSSSSAEQIIALPQKRQFTWRKLVDEKSILYIVIPESSKNMYPFVKIIIQQICNRLSDYAILQKGRTLPRIVKILWDEFGVSPKIENIDTLLSVCRGHGILFDLIYQDRNQLKKTYGDEVMKIIENNCGTSVIIGVAPKNDEGAKRISTILGNQTVRSGSVNYTKNNGKSSNSISESMIGKPLMAPNDVMRLAELNRVIILKRGYRPFLAYLSGYYKKEWILRNERNFEYSRCEDSKFYTVESISLNQVKQGLIEQRYSNLIGININDENIVTDEKVMNKNEMINKVFNEVGIKIEEDDTLFKYAHTGNYTLMKKWLKDYYNKSERTIRVLIKELKKIELMI